jgi:hypothetical protein
MPTSSILFSTGFSIKHLIDAKGDECSMRGKSNQYRRGKKRVNYSTLNEQEKAEYGRAIDLLYDLRNGDDPYTKLLGKHRLTERQAQRYLGSNLSGGARGKRVQVSKTDRLVRILKFPRPFG